MLGFFYPTLYTSSIIFLLTLVCKPTLLNGYSLITVKNSATVQCATETRFGNGELNPRSILSNTNLPKLKLFFSKTFKFSHVFSLLESTNLQIFINNIKIFGIRDPFMIFEMLLKCFSFISLLVSDFQRSVLSVLSISVAVLGYSHLPSGRLTEITKGPTNV